MKSSLCFAWFLCLAGCASTVVGQANDGHTGADAAIDGQTLAGPVIDAQPVAPLDPAHVVVIPWASAGVAYTVSAALLNVPNDYARSGCGTFVTLGTTTTVTGMSCTGTGPIAGTLTVEGTASGEQTATANQFVQQTRDQCNGATVFTTTTLRGTVHRTPQSDGSFQFHVDLIVDWQRLALATCQITTTQYGLLYDGTFRPRPGSMATDNLGTFNGSGRLSASGWGQVHGQTTDEVLDGTCTSNVGFHGVSSGTTTVTSGSHVAVLTYGNHCRTGTSDVDWTLDGVAQGAPIPNVVCTAQPWRASGPPGMTMALGALATMTTVLRRRTRRRAP